MRDSLPMIEDRLRRAGIIKKDLSGLITQGGFNKGGVAASAGTHDGGGAADWTGRIATDDTVRILRECGIAAWIRRPGQGRWPLHIHGVWNGCPHVSAGAARQVTAWKAGRNGLASNGRDDGPKVPIVTWKQALNAWTQTANATPNTGGFKPVTPKPTQPQPTPTPQEDDVPTVIEKIIDFHHNGDNWQTHRDDKGQVIPFHIAKGPIKAMHLHAVVHGPEGHRLGTRWGAWVPGRNGKPGFWSHSIDTAHATSRAETNHQGFTVDDGVQLTFDVWTTEPGDHRIVITGLVWE